MFFMKKIIIGITVVIILAIGGYIGFSKYQEYIHSNPYLLSKHGYTETEIKQILDNIKNVEHILEIPHHSKLTSFIKQKYFIEKNLDEYLSYHKENQDQSIQNVIAIINTKQSKEHYTNISKTDTSKKEQMLVNKYHQLGEDFIPENIVKISTKYAYANNEIKKEVLDAYIDMWNHAKKDGITLIITSGYRSYQSQEKVYQNYVRSRGEKYADTYAARPGFSEHQTGLALDIFGYGTTKETFENSDAYTWLKNNAYKYGFILRYPKEKESLTGYNYESWHYRYLGKKQATQVFNEGITYDEYYAYYIENGEK